jgi:hypothetical protein
MARPLLRQVNHRLMALLDLPPANPRPKLPAGRLLAPHRIWLNPEHSLVKHHLDRLPLDQTSSRHRREPPANRLNRPRLAVNLTRPRSLGHLWSVSRVAPRPPVDHLGRVSQAGLPLKPANPVY